MQISKHHAYMTMTVQAEIDDITRNIEVIDYLKVKPWRGLASSCPSLDDYLGYTDIEYYVLNDAGEVDQKLTDGLTEEQDAHVQAVVEAAIENLTGSRKGVDNNA